MSNLMDNNTNNASTFDNTNINIKVSVPKWSVRGEQGGRRVVAENLKC